MPYSGIFSHSHKEDIINAHIDPKQFNHVKGLAKIKSQKLAAVAERIKKQCSAVSLLQRLDCYPRKEETKQSVYKEDAAGKNHIRARKKLGLVVHHLVFTLLVIQVTR